MQIALLHPRTNPEAIITRIYCTRAGKHSLHYLQEQGRFNLVCHLGDEWRASQTDNLQLQAVSICQPDALSNLLNIFTALKQPYQFQNHITLVMNFGIQLPNAEWQFHIAHSLSVRQGNKLILLQDGSLVRER